MDLGLIKGTSFKVVKVAPLGDPVEINVRGYELSIRKEEAAVTDWTEDTNAICNCCGCSCFALRIAETYISADKVRFF